MTMHIYPYKFCPIYKERIWGGRNLRRLFGRQFPEGKNIGESWELADLPGDSSTVANGPDAGKTLHELTTQLGGGLLGRARPMPDGGFPLLLKLLDASDILSLQVHPDAAAVKQIGPDAALKTECWYVLDSRGGFIYKGVQPGVTAGQFAAAVAANTVERLIRKVPVTAGDFHYLPAGLVHALGPGVVVAEVQTPSDTTYRVTDWGRGREIHVAHSMQCIRFGLTGDSPPGAGGDTLLSTDFFMIKLRSAESLAAETLPAGLCTALMVLHATGQVEIRSDAPVEHILPVGGGDTILLPAALRQAAMTVRGKATWLEITLPDKP